MPNDKRQRQPESSRDEVDREFRYDRCMDKLKDLNPNEAARFQNILDKQKTDKAFRYPWSEMSIDEAKEWAVQFCMVAIAYGIQQKYIARDIYQGHYDQFLSEAWAEALNNSIPVRQEMNPPLGFEGDITPTGKNTPP